jgi:hypothetical protein
MNKTVKKVILYTDPISKSEYAGTPTYLAKVFYTLRGKKEYEPSDLRESQLRFEMQPGYHSPTELMYEVGLILDLEGGNKTAAFGLEEIDGAWVFVYRGQHY